MKENGNRLLDDLEERKEIIRNWWFHTKPISPLVEYDLLFSSYLEEHYYTLVSYLAFVYTLGFNPKVILFEAIENGYIEELISKSCTNFIDYDKNDVIVALIDELFVGIEDKETTRKRVIDVEYRVVK